MEFDLWGRLRNSMGQFEWNIWPFLHHCQCQNFSAQPTKWLQLFAFDPPFMNVQTCFAQFTLFRNNYFSFYSSKILLFINKSYIKNRPSDQFDTNDFRARFYSQNSLSAQLFFPSILPCIHRFMFDIIRFCWMIFISIKNRSCSSAHRTFKNALTSNRKWKTQILNIIHRCCCNSKLRYIILMLRAARTRLSNKTQWKENI